MIPGWRTKFPHAAQLGGCPPPKSVVCVCMSFFKEDEQTDRHSSTPGSSLRTDKTFLKTGVVCITSVMSIHSLIHHPYTEVKYDPKGKISN